MLTIGLSRRKLSEVLFHKNLNNQNLILQALNYLRFFSNAH